MGLTLLTGVPGVGSSTVCEAARRRLDDVQLVNFTDAMLERAAATGLADSRVELSSLAPRDVRRLQRRAGEYVADRCVVRDVLLNAYLAVETADGYLPGLPADALDRTVPDQVVPLEADPSTVAERRRESARPYAVSRDHAVRVQQEINRTATVSLAMDADSPVRHLGNEGEVEAAVADLVDTLEGSD